MGLPQMSDETYSQAYSRSLSQIVQDLKGYLEYLKELGCEGVSLSETPLRRLGQWDNRFTVESLETIREDLGECKRCKLHKGRKQIVFGAGDPKARLLLVGEGPGYEEDVQGLPFVGAAGQLLTKILAAIGLTRQEVYICNIIKCRPPGNRNPEPDEIAACFPFLERQIKAIRPGLICTLGTFAGQALLGSDKPISQLRGHFHAYGEIPVLPTYHPAFLLRNPGKKREVWEDMQKLRGAYEAA